MLGCLCHTLVAIWCKLLGGSGEWPWKCFDVKFSYENVISNIPKSGEENFSGEQFSAHLNVLILADA